jgi:large repetitive protein
MASFKGYDRDDAQKRRQGQRKTRRNGIPRIEFLEKRQLLASGDTLPAPLWKPSDPTNLLDAQNGPMANLGAETVEVYSAWLNSNGNTSQLPSEFPKVEFQNGMVGLDVKSLGGSFSQFLTSLTDLGMQITTSNATYAMADGYAPINDLPAIAEMAQTQSGEVAYTPIAYASNYQGIAYNEAETSMFADVARTEFNVDGTGVTIGVLSTSVNQYQGGLSESYGTGDLNPNNPVNVIQDDPGDPTDEGRAMLENIHDIAPGANLQFATATLNELSFASNIEALQKAGSNIIVDDVGYFDEPMFQDGVVAQAVNTVVGEGVTYFSSAGNEGPDSGYLSTFRPSTGNITNIGAGTFMNFNPNGGTNLELPITTTIPNASLTFEFDQPYQFYQPAGSTGVVTSQVNVYIIDATTGAVVWGNGANPNQNNVATEQPLQIATIPAAGSYFLAVQVVSGANPGHIEFVGNNDTNGALNVSQEYASAGGTSYPSSYGHATAANTIGVGATPWWAPSPYLGQNPLQNEPFSSSGPALTVFNVNGVPLSSPVTVDNPTITAPDGGNTSFFSPGQIINTSDPAPGQPATATNLSQDLPSFFGTSSAAPNAAAVAALMLQEVPTLTPAEIRAGLIAGATPMNGQTQGSWVAADGYGLVNAINAINAVDLLRVVSTTPANGSTVTVSPSAITVTFNKPVNFSTVSAADLTFTSAPLGVTVILGTPIAIGSQTDPTTIQFPFSFTRSAAATTANGGYTFSIQSPANETVESEDGKTLVPSGSITFALADTTSPTITSTSVSGRTVSITFSKAINPATVTGAAGLANIYVLRQGGQTAWPPTPATLANYINLNNFAGVGISYNPTNFTVTLNYSQLPQVDMPSDRYAIVVISPATPAAAGVTDLVGNPLFGKFNGGFPTGVGETTPQDFIQNLGLEVLSAPIITTFEMTPTAANDTGIVGDQNTNITNPTFIGQVFASFPGTVAGLQVFIGFGNQANQGVPNLTVGTGGRGTGGSFTEVVTTDANGTFNVTSSGLLQGFQDVVAVVVGQPDSPPLPGLASSYTDTFRIDETAPQLTGASILDGGTPLPLPNSPEPNVTPLNGLTTLTIYAVDDVTQFNTNLVTPSTVIFDALNPITADNISNYSLINTSENDEDESAFILTAVYVDDAPTFNSATNPTFILAYNGHINLTFAPGLPAGQYTFVAHTTELQYPGITDAAGNPINDTVNPPGLATKDFVINFDVSPQPVYITSMALESTYSNTGSTVIGTQGSFFELPSTTTGTNTRDNVAAPPQAVVIDFSSPLPYSSNGVQIDYSNDVQLIGSANGPGQSADGDFGNLGQGGLGSTGSGFTVIPGTTVVLYSFDQATQTWAPTAPGGSGTRLVMSFGQLSADDYTVYVPNQVEPGNINTQIFDIYGNQLDGENVGNQTSQTNTGPGSEFPDSSVNVPLYEDLQSNGTYRMDDLSGDGIAGGAFAAAFTVVNYGNVVFAQPGYVENPLNPATYSNGSMANPYPVLAPEGNPNTAPANPNHLPNGGLNSSTFWTPGNFNTAFDFSGDGKFEQSALYAASQLSFAEPGNTQLGFQQLGGPVVVVALPGIPQRNPITGNISQAAFVLQAPAGNNSGVTNGSTSVPYNTTLVFDAGSTLKLENASLFVQNQGSALQSDGTASDPVTFTSYNNSAAGGATNDNPNTNPQPGDWGGIVFRNYDQSATPTVSFPVDGTLLGLNGADAVSGASALMSSLNFFNISYGGGAVPEGSSTFYSAITLYGSAPTISNGTIEDTGGPGGTEAAIGADLDSFLEDDTTPDGPLIRQITVQNNSLNALWLMSEPSGFIEPTNSMPNIPTNPSALGGSQNYNFFEPLPFAVLAQLVVGQELLENTGGDIAFVPDRLYIEPGVMMKFAQGSALDVINPAASLNVGSRSYITGFDQNNGYNPQSAGFVAESASDPLVLFTSIYDDDATTTIVPAINVTNETPAQMAARLAPASWGSVGIQSGAVAVINAAIFQYGGGEVNTQNFTIPSQSVLAFLTDYTDFNLPATAADDLGTHVYVTNNYFFNNFDAAMQIEPNGLLAGNPVTPLESGDPFLRGNVMTGNGIDALMVLTLQTYKFTNNFTSYLGPFQAISAGGAYSNLSVDSVWDLTDITYVLQGTLIIDGAYQGELFNGDQLLNAPVPSTTAYGAIPTPLVSLTIQSALPGTLLADGETIPSPGQSVIVKLYSDNTPQAVDTAGIGATQNAGAGFVVGVDDGIDPPANSPLVDPGAYSQLRILGIPGNQTTGQQRVPVILTSLRDDTVGTTVRGTVMDDIWNSAPVQQYIAAGNGTTFNLTTPEAGDGGYIYIGAESLNEYDPTNPLEGSIIDNADISYMSSIQIQGGGIVDTGATPSPLYPNDRDDNLAGNAGPASQFNAGFAFTIDDSNLSDFSDAAVFVHPDFLDELDRTITAGSTVAPAPVRGSLVGEPVDLYMYNNTISNSAIGVEVNPSPGDNSTGNTPYEAVLLNNTFFNDAFGLQTNTSQFDGQNSNAIVNVEAMNNIFDGSSSVAVNMNGQAGQSQLQYNLFFNDVANLLITTTDADFGGNIGAVFADPEFVGPVGNGDASAQNFELEPTSPAINAARSEIGPNAGANAVFPTVNLVLSGGVVTLTRTDPNTLTFPEQPGRVGEFAFGVTDPRQILTLPGSGFFSFPDEWAPTVTGGFSGSTAGNFSTTGTYNYAPVTGQRDILGYIRAPQAGGTGTGYGSNPFMDIGAYQYVNLNPPEVTGVTETPTQGATPVNFYSVGGISGVNQTPWSINVTFNGPISPGTLNANTVKLVDLGSNPSQPLDEDINLSGKITYNTATDTLVINLAAAGLTLGTDAYQITLFGSGSPVITNLQGVALDGENTVGGSATGAQLALPSGNGYPGGNFFDSFIINTTPPAVAPGTLTMAAASDTNIVGDDITTSALPTFNGNISEPNPNLVPLAGQTVILDVGIEFNGVTYFSTTGAPASLAQFIRQNAGTAVSTTGGAFAVTVGTDAANTGLVTNTGALPNLFGTYNVGSSGILSPLPGTVNGYYVARIRVVDQSGNQSNPSDPNSQLPFVVDDTPPTVNITSPAGGQVVTSLNNGVLTFTITTSKNIDLTHFNASSIALVSAGPDGVLGTTDDVAIPINGSSISVKYLDQGIGGPGAEQITFSSEPGTGLTNNLYAVTLLNTGPDAVRDIAGNLLAAPVGQIFAVNVPSLAKNLFVEEGADATTATGTRELPYATIGAAMKAASAGDVIAVLPGVYQEQVTLKQGVKLYSAATSSTDSTVFTTSTGDALSTIIRAPFAAAAPAGTYATITATGIVSLNGLSTEVAGFTIASPLVSNPASGTINPSSVAFFVMNSNITLDKDYFIDAGTGIAVTTSGASALTPLIYNDGIIGNINGLVINDAGSTPSTTPPVQVVNDDFAFNTNGLVLDNSLSSPIQAYVASNIFWENHDQTLARNGFAIISENVNKVNLQNNLFYGNGASDTNQTAATNNLGNGFSPALLGTTAAAAGSNLGNFVGNPAFAFPIDPRPGSDGPANFYIDADFELTAVSAAIDNAWEATAIPTDFLGNSQVEVNGGLGITGNGPRDIGAFEFNGVGGQAIGGSFRVVTNSLAPVAGQLFAAGGTDSFTTSPTSITLTFSGDVNPAEISATDLLLSGSAINPSSPVHVTSLTWIDGYTVQFNLAGQFNTSGTLDLAVAPNAITSTTGSANVGYSDSAVIKITPTVSPTGTPTPTSTPTSTSSPTTPAPSPKAAPKGPLHKKKPAPVHHAKKVEPKHVVIKHKVAEKPKAKKVEHKVVAKKVEHKVVAKKVEHKVVKKVEPKVEHKKKV